LVDIIHATPFGFLFYYFLRLLFGAYKENALSITDQVSNIIIGSIQHDYGLLQVDNVDTVALCENITFHTWMPVAGKVAEMGSGFQ
jgi:hypothetical protein